MSITHVVVYSKSGKSETHTRLNANDLVRNSGYTYEPGKTFLPTDEPAYKRLGRPEGLDPAQRVLDSHGSRGGADALTYTPPEQPIVFDAGAGKAIQVATSSEPVEVAPVVRAPRPAPAPVMAPVEDADEELDEVVEEVAPVKPVAAPVVEEVEAPAAEEAPAAPKERQRRPKKGAE